MALEIERKFLVRTESWRDTADAGQRIQQAYLSNVDTNTVRIRIVDERAACLTVKSACAGIRRKEFEYDVPLNDALAMLDLRNGHLIDKIRYRVMHEAMVWEIDVYSGLNRGLVIAEVELTHEDQLFEKPDWLGIEVSGDLSYRNSALARHPFTCWSSSGDAGPNVTGQDATARPAKAP